MKKKFVITAYRHVGKTTLVKKVLAVCAGAGAVQAEAGSGAGAIDAGLVEKLGTKVCGFFTEKIDFDRGRTGAAARQGVAGEQDTSDQNAGRDAMNLQDLQTLRQNLKTPIEPGRFPVFIYPIDAKDPLGSQPIIDDDHIVGLCGCGTHYTNFEVFDTLGVEYLSAPDSQTLIVLDEVGFMEMGAEKYKEKIFEILKSDNPVLLMLKDRMDIELIKQIRDFPGVTFIEMNEDNRDEVTERVIADILR